jgi:hypothetical protein
MTQKEIKEYYKAQRKEAAKNRKTNDYRKDAGYAKIYENSAGS